MEEESSRGMVIIWNISVKTKQSSVKIRQGNTEEKNYWLYQCRKMWH